MPDLQRQWHSQLQSKPVKTLVWKKSTEESVGQLQAPTHGAPAAHFRGTGRIFMATALPLDVSQRTSIGNGSDYLQRRESTPFGSETSDCS